jgi:hypothetical protein
VPFAAYVRSALVTERLPSPSPATRGVPAPKGLSWAAAADNSSRKRLGAATAASIITRPLTPTKTKQTISPLRPITVRIHRISSLQLTTPLTTRVKNIPQQFVPMRINHKTRGAKQYAATKMLPRIVKVIRDYSR